MRKLINSLFFVFAFPPVYAETNDLDEFALIQDFIVKPPTRDIIRQLQNGGFVLYMRHGHSDTNHPDRLPSIDLNDCTTQRPLTEVGRRISAGVGYQIRRLNIPIGEVYSSPMCRTIDTARAAFGPKITVSKFLMYLANLTGHNKTPVLDATRELISKPVYGKVNRVVVAHPQNLMEIIGYLPKPEATIVIFQPRKDNLFKYIASITPDQWRVFETPKRELPQTNLP